MKRHPAFKGNPYFLQNAHYTCVTLWCEANNANVITNDFGEHVLPAGTIWPSNTSGVNAVGIVYRDVVIPDGEPGATFSCLTHGYINAHYFPVAQADIDATLPATIQFCDGEIGSVAADIGYFIVKIDTPDEISAGQVAAGTEYEVEIELDTAAATAGYLFKTTAQIGDLVLSNSAYPLQISELTATTSSLTVTIVATKGFHAHLGDVVAITVRDSAITAPSGYMSLDSNTVHALVVA